MRCPECDEELTEEEIKHPVDRGDGIICATCDSDHHHWICELCEDLEDEDYLADFFAVLDGEEAGISTGIYKILSRPFYSQGLIGGGQIWTNRVQKIAELPPDAKANWAPCAFLCSSCAVPYAQLSEG